MHVMRCYHAKPTWLNKAYVTLAVTTGNPLLITLCQLKNKCENFYENKTNQCYT